MALNIIRAGTTATRTLPDGVKRSIMAYDEDVTLSFMRSDTKEGFDSSHSHPHRQIVYVISGSGVFCIEGETGTMNAGDCVTIPANASHTFISFSEPTEWLEFFTPGRDDLRAEFKLI